MKPILKMTLVDQTRERLLDALFEEGWSGLIPSTRMLSKSLQVSTHTLGKALESLVSAGVLVSGGPKRRLRVAMGVVPPRKPAAAAPQVSAGKVLCLSREPLHRMPRMGLEFTTHLRTRLPQMDLRHHATTFDKCRSPRRAWGRLLELEDPDHLLVIEGSLDVARWAADCGVPTVFLGGEPGARWMTEGLPAAGTKVHLPMQWIKGDSIAPPRAQ